MLTSATIFALATPARACPLALIRVSGPAVASVARALCAVSMARASITCEVSLPAGRVPCIAWVLPGPGTLTGEDTLELCVPGNPAIARQLEQRLRDLGCRDAEAGEFTRRALEAGKLDLSQAQAVMALVSAASEAARLQALADLSGRTHAALADIAERLRAISARFEMSFDFSEEEHAESEEHTLRRDVATLAGDLAGLLGTTDMPPAGQQPVVALFGPPNAGKSSLFNALLGSDRALVSELPGTTRDPVEADCKFGQHSVTLVDLSGVGATDADVGRYSAGTRDRALQADVLLVLAAPGQRDAAAVELALLEARDQTLGMRTLCLRTMVDLCPRAESDEADTESLAVSSSSGIGMAELRARVAARLAASASGGVTSPMRQLSRDALALLRRDPLAAPEALASDVRRALAVLDNALMREAPGEVLDLIFSRFCIGK